MIVNAGKLEEAILQAMREINDACLTLRQEGVTVLLPEFVDFDVQLVTGNDINAVQRTSSESEADGGVTTTLREQLGSDVETSVRSSEQNSNSSKVSGTGTETSTMNHPTVRTDQVGGDSSDQTIRYDYSANA
jgi:hypothetical protein